MADEHPRSRPDPAHPLPPPRMMRPCLNCGRPAKRSRCDLCSAEKAIRFGYNSAEYRANRIRCLMEEPNCWICGKPGDLLDPLTADHIIPVIAGGTHERSNLRAAHRSCNSRRGSDGHDHKPPAALVAITEQRRRERTQRQYVPNAWNQREAEAAAKRRHIRAEVAALKRIARRVEHRRRGREAATLRRNGLSWQAIADALNCHTPTNIIDDVRLVAPELLKYRGKGRQHIRDGRHRAVRKILQQIPSPSDVGSPGTELEFAL